MRVIFLYVYMHIYFFIYSYIKNVILLNIAPFLEREPSNTNGLEHGAQCFYCALYCALFGVIAPFLNYCALFCLFLSLSDTLAMVKMGSLLDSDTTTIFCWSYSNANHVCQCNPLAFSSLVQCLLLICINQTISHTDAIKTKKIG